MTDEEKLAAISKALAAAGNDPLQPACVARAFLDPHPPQVFGITLPQVTMRAWLALESARSPFVTGEWMEDAAARVQALCTAIETISEAPLFPESIIGYEDPATVLEAEAIVSHRVNASFETFLALRRKPLPGEKVESTKDAGTGWWVKILAKLMGDLGMSLAEALNTAVPVAFALVGAAGVNKGLEVVGESWIEREVMNKVERDIA